MWTQEQNSALQSATDTLSVNLQKSPTEIADQIKLLAIPATSEHSGWDNMPDNAKGLIGFIYPQLQNATYLNSLKWSFDGTFYNAYFFQQGYKMSASVTNALSIFQFEKENAWIPNLPQPIQDYITAHLLTVTKAIKGVYNPNLENHTSWWTNQIPKTKYTIIADKEYLFDGNGNLIP